MSLPIRYELTTLARQPLMAYWRRRLADASPLVVAMCEAARWRRSAFAFMVTYDLYPDMLQDDLEPGSVVVDAGAYTGEWARSMLERGDSRIVAFEPSPIALKRLRAGVGREYPQLEIVPVALGRSDSRATLSEDAAGSSLFGTKEKFGSSGVEVRDVDAVFREQGLADRDIDLLKVNIEGGEYDLFDRLWETGWFPQIDRVLVQFHEWLPAAHRRRRQIRRRLAKTHDQVWCYPWIWERWRRRS